MSDFYFVQIKITEAEIEKMLEGNPTFVLDPTDEPTSPHSIPEFFGKGKT